MLDHDPADDALDPTTRCQRHGCAYDAAEQCPDCELEHARTFCDIHGTRRDARDGECLDCALDATTLREMDAAAAMSLVADYFLRKLEQADETTGAALAARFEKKDGNQ